MLSEQGDNESHPGEGRSDDPNPTIISALRSAGGLRGIELPALESSLRREGLRLNELAHGIDESPVVSDRTAQSVYAEETFAKDVPLSEMEPLIRRLAEAAPDFFGVPKNSVSTETMDWRYRMFLDRFSVKVLSDLLTLMNESDCRAQLRTIRTATLILKGDIDKSAPLELTRYPTHELIAGSQLLVYENAAPGLPYTRTDRVVAVIAAFTGV
jgi:pimeloyl-ACP methyl ester carboxylesterase